MQIAAEDDTKRPGLWMTHENLEAKKEAQFGVQEIDPSTQNIHDLAVLWINFRGGVWWGLYNYIL